jgi:hypothetical protein
LALEVHEGPPLRELPCGCVESTIDEENDVATSILVHLENFLPIEMTDEISSPVANLVLAKCKLDPDGFGTRWVRDSILEMKIVGIENNPTSRPNVAQTDLERLKHGCLARVVFSDKYGRLVEFQIEMLDAAEVLNQDSA